MLNRTSQGLSLITAGQDYYESAFHLIGEFEEAETHFGPRTRGGRGPLFGWASLGVSSAEIAAVFAVRPRPPSTSTCQSDSSA